MKLPAIGTLLATTLLLFNTANATTPATPAAPATAAPAAAPAAVKQPVPDYVILQVGDDKIKRSEVENHLEVDLPRRPGPGFRFVR